jgi:hypothetical protein
MLGVDSYGATSFAPVLPAPANVAVKQTEELGRAATMMSTAAPSPPTMYSQNPQPQPRAVITPAVYTPPPQPVPVSYAPTMSSAALGTPPPQPSPLSGAQPYVPQPYNPYAMMLPGQMMMQQAPVSQQGTPGLAIAAFVCGLLGWIPFWIGFILCLLAITFSTIVLGTTRSSTPGRGYAIAGLVLGLVLLLPAACGL